MLRYRAASTTRDTMTVKGLRKLARRLTQLRRGTPNAGDVVSLVKKFGRRRVTGKRTKEPTYVSKRFPDLRPIHIPLHGGGQIAPGTATQVLDQLEADDLRRWEREFEAGGYGNAENDDDQ